MEIEEEFISGFCRTCNGGQTVCCEYTMEGDKRTLTFMDCTKSSELQNVLLRTEGIVIRKCCNYRINRS